MSDYTSKLNLYKVNPAIDGENKFNINTMMNENWDKIDTKVKNMDEKLGGVEDNANNYIHPNTHDADIIKISDTGNHFTGDNVEDALEEVGTQLADIANVIVASGTGTAITLSMPSVTAYTANMKLTFIAKANNNGNTTTININGKGAKKLYKPNTTVTPNIKTGKPYTVWYNGTHFFLQASAEGNALAEHVLAGKTFSNDDDTGIIGIMNLSNLIASNIRKGVSINGIVGTLVPMQYAVSKAIYAYESYSPEWTVSNLAFKPKVVFVFCKLKTGIFAYHIDNPNGNFNLDTNSYSFSKNCSGSPYVTISDILNDGFKFKTSIYDGQSSQYIETQTLAIG